MINKKMALLLMLSLGSRVTLFGADKSKFIDLFYEQVVVEKGSIEKIVKQESTGNTLLHHAILHGTKDNVKKVLNFKGCDSQCLLTENKEGNSALHLAVVKSDLEIVKAILAHKECKEEFLKKKNKQDQTALHLAVVKGDIEIVQAVLDHNDSGRTLLSMQNTEGKTALYLAVDQQNVEIVNALLAQEVKKNKNWGDAVNTAVLKDKKSKSAVALAIERKNKDILLALLAHLKNQRALGIGYGAFKTQESIDLEKAVEAVIHEIEGTVRVTTEPKANAKPSAIVDSEDDLLDMSELEKDERGTVVIYEAGKVEELKKAVEVRNGELLTKDPNTDVSALSFNVDTYKQRTDEKLKIAKKEEKKVVAKAAEEVKKAQEAIQGEEQSSLSAKHVIGGAGLLAACYLMYTIVQEVIALKKELKAKQEEAVRSGVAADEVEEPSSFELLFMVLQNKFSQLVG